MDDRTLAKSIESDPFHTGLAKYGEFTGFAVEPAMAPMTDAEIKASRALMARLISNPQVLLVLTYLGLILLIGKVYA